MNIDYFHMDLHERIKNYFLSMIFQIATLQSNVELVSQHLIRRLVD